MTKPQPAAAREPTPQVISLFVKGKKIYPRSVSGWFATWRWALVALTQLLFYGLPWLQWRGRQAVLFDLAARRFYIFDMVLYPQDFIYLAVLLIISAYALFLFTAVAGRLWCGFACPQTVYTEIFLAIERFFEGDRIAQMRRAAAPWSLDKAGRMGAKHAVWLTLSLWTGFTLVGYFTPILQLWAEAFTLDFGPWEWFWVVFYGLATYGNAGWLREQVCKYMCPYARFQSAMIDKDSLIISYDARRGEPRGSRPRNADPRAQGLGDCIDCGLCVQVCPTGIDIRKGLQYECIGCAACIDVCNGVMDKMAYPKGLIRYATQNGLEQGLSKAAMWRRVARPRVLIYSGLLLAVCLAFAWSLFTRAPLRVDVLRDRGSLARILDEGQIENVYRLQLMNATQETQQIRVAVSGLPGATVVPLPSTSLGPAQARWLPVAVRLPADAAARVGPGAHALVFELSLAAPEPLVSGGAIEAPEAVVRERSSFVVPR